MQTETRDQNITNKNKINSTDNKCFIFVISDGLFFRQLKSGLRQDVVFPRCLPSVVVNRCQASLQLVSA